MLRSDRVAGAILCAFSLWVLWLAWPLPFGGAHNPGPGFLPRLLGMLLFAASLLVVLRGGASARIDGLGWSELPRVAALAGGLAFAALALETLGYRLTMFALLVFYLGVVERLPIIWVATLSVALPFGAHWVIDTMLRTPLPRGALGW
jgi:hypothetical protein